MGKLFSTSVAFFSVAFFSVATSLVASFDGGRHSAWSVCVVWYKTQLSHNPSASPEAQHDAQVHACSPSESHVASFSQCLLWPFTPEHSPKAQQSRARTRTIVAVTRRSSHRRLRPGQ